MSNVLKFVKKDKPCDALGIASIEGGHLYLRTNQLIRKTFGRKGELLDYIASHIEAGIYEEHNGKYFLYKSARALAEYFDISISQIKRWIGYFKDNGILTVEKFSKTYNINYMSINSDVLREFVVRRAELVEKLNDESVPEEEKKELLKQEEALIIERLEDSNSEIADLELKQEQDVMLLSAIGEIVDPLKQANIPLKFIELWNEEFNTTVKLSVELSRNIVAAFKVKFKNDFELVEKYFKVLHERAVNKTLEQVLGYYFIDKWLAYLNADVGDSTHKQFVSHKKIEEKAVEVEDIDIKRERQNKQEPKACIEARDKIAQKIGESYYRSWFHLSTFSIIGKVLTIVAPNNFTKSKQIELYQDVLNGLFGKGNVIIL